ncbi:MAG: hypothetical protein AAF478_09145 [Pseudomonadota bacterium]
MFRYFASPLVISGIVFAGIAGAPGYVSEAKAFGLCTPDDQLLENIYGGGDKGVANTFAVGAHVGTLDFDDPFIDENSDFFKAYGSYGFSLYDTHVLQLNVFGGTLDDPSDEIDTLGGSVQLGIKQPFSTGSHIFDFGYEQTRYDTFSSNDRDLYWIGGQGKCYTNEITVGASIGFANIDFDNNFLEDIDSLYYSGDLFRYINPYTRFGLGFDAGIFDISSSGSSQGANVFRIGAGIDWQITPEQPIIFSVGVGQSTINSNSPGNRFEVTDFKVGVKFFNLDGASDRTPSLQEYDVRGINFYHKPRALELFR